MVEEKNNEIKPEVKEAAQSAVQHVKSTVEHDQAPEITNDAPAPGGGPNLTTTTPRPTQNKSGKGNSR